MLNKAIVSRVSRAIAKSRASSFVARFGRAKFLSQRLFNPFGCKPFGLAAIFLFLAVNIPSPVQAAELQEILKRGYLIVGVKDHLRPLAFTDGQGQLEGFEIDLAHYLAAELLGNSEAIVLKPLTMMMLTWRSLG
jgi:ABC-type amino acid transport substrate-binding protein